MPLPTKKPGEKEQAFMDDAQKLEKWRLDQNKELSEREEGLLKRLESDVREALAKIGSKGKYSFVVRRDLMLYMNSSAKDLTDKVLDVLREASE